MPEAALEHLAVEIDHDFSDCVVDPALEKLVEHA